MFSRAYLEGVRRTLVPLIQRAPLVDPVVLHADCLRRAREAARGVYQIAEAQLVRVQTFFERRFAHGLIFRLNQSPPEDRLILTEDVCSHLFRFNPPIQGDLYGNIVPSAMTYLHFDAGGMAREVRLFDLSRVLVHEVMNENERSVSWFMKCLGKNPGGFLLDLDRISGGALVLHDARSLNLALAARRLGAEYFGGRELGNLPLPFRPLTSFR